VVTFTEESVSYDGVEPSEVVRWDVVRTVTVMVPTMSARTWWGWRVLGWFTPQFILLEPPEIVAALIGRSFQSGWEWDLGRPVRPFSRRVMRGTVGLLLYLERQGLDRLLGDPVAGPDLLEVAIRQVPRDRMFIDTRIARALERRVVERGYRT